MTADPERLDPVHLVHPDGSRWEAVPAQDLTVALTIVRGGQTTTRTKSFSDRRTQGRFLSEGTARMVRAGYHPVGSRLPELRAEVEAARARLVGKRPQARIPRVWELWRSRPFQGELGLMWKHGGFEELVAPLAQTPTVRDALVRACVGQWTAAPLAFVTDSPVFLELARLRALEAELAALERETAPALSFGIPGRGEDLGSGLRALVLAAGVEADPEWLEGVPDEPEAGWAVLGPRVQASFARPGAQSELLLRALEDEAGQVSRPG